jgi:glycine/sarcosine N-methyltransferase
MPLKMTTDDYIHENPNDLYRSIAKFYSEIFPYNPDQLQFVKRFSDPLQDKNILDIGCATGELSFQLAQKGARVTGIDLNEELIRQAQARKSMQNLKFRVGDMLETSQYFPENHFDTTLCFGNTLVHLSSPEAILQMMKEVYKTLKSGGYLLLQIINYDYILSEKILELPLIETDNIKFIRKYRITEDSPVIRFQTELIMKTSNKPKNKNVTIEKQVNTSVH